MRTWKAKELVQNVRGERIMRSWQAKKQVRCLWREWALPTFKGSWQVQAVSTSVKYCTSIARSRDWHWNGCSLLELLHELYIGRTVSIASGIVHGSCSLIAAARFQLQLTKRVVASASVHVDS